MYSTEWDAVRINHLLVGVGREKTITVAEWTEIKDALLLNLSSFVRKIIEFIFLPREIVNGARIIFPSCLTKEERQILHIFASQYASRTFTSSRNTAQTLNIFIRTNNFLVN